MERFNTLNGAVGAPSAPSAPVNKYFTEGNPGGGIPATTPGPWWFHMITEELRALIAAASIVPDHTNLTQVYQAVQALISANGARSKVMTLTGGTVAANAMTVGFPAQSLDFRSATAGSGAVTTITTGALSLVIPSGATLGAINGQQAQLILLVASNAGSPVLCVVNAAGGVNLDETGFISPTTISAAATSASTIYSASAVAAGSPYRVVGYLNSTQAVAGAYATPAALVQGYGGQALAALQSLGFGQTPQTVTRSSGTTYFNTTGRPIFITAYITSSGGGGMNTQISINGGPAVVMVYTTGASTQNIGSFVIPAGASYTLTDGGSISSRITTEIR